MLIIKNLKVGRDDVAILKGINLVVKPGEVHAIMGPNGSGKSTLVNVLAGRDGYQVQSGSVAYKKADLLAMSVEDRARQGVFLAMQYPVELPGVSMNNFLREASNASRRYRGESELDALDFVSLLARKKKIMDISDVLTTRSVNDGFSGGEKKKAEIFQMAVLEPDLAILDETDSGLDVDALRVVSEAVNKMRSKKRAIILITHYKRILDYIEPDFVHVLRDGKIVESGNKKLATKIDKDGYA